MSMSGLLQLPPPQSSRIDGPTDSVLLKKGDLAVVKGDLVDCLGIYPQFV